ncbi:MAG: endopeptidase La, partial [Chloroflexaceae bacterium]|nr:endopeptidase La [Chloroflexaceae bacterium]
LRGRVLPIGGVKEKLLAAQRAGVTMVLLPQDNATDLREVPEEAREQLELILVSHMDEVLPYVLASDDTTDTPIMHPSQDGEHTEQSR